MTGSERLRAMNDYRNEMDGVPGESWMDPRDVLLVTALAAHPERALIEARREETDAIGEPRWSLRRQLEDDGWVEVWLRPWPLDRPDERPPIKVGRWPMKEGEVEPLARAEAIIEEHDDPRR